MASIDPITTDSVECLIRQVHLGKEAVASPAFVYRELLPLMVHDVDETAVDTLDDVLRRVGTGPLTYDEARLADTKCENSQAKEISRLWLANHELELACALQILANITNLSDLQQQVVWDVYKEEIQGVLSMNVQAKCLCLLVLGWQRPVSERTMHELLHVVRKNPLSDLVSDHGLSPRQTFGLLIMDSMLRSAGDDATVKRYRKLVERAMVQAASILRAMYEKQFTSMARIGSDADMQGPIFLLRGIQANPENEYWKPSDTAYGLLRGQIIVGLPVI